MKNASFHSPKKTFLSAIIVSALCGSGVIPVLAATDSFHEAAQSGQITGVVTDADGEPIIGASVMVKGTNNGAITDFEGKFHLADTEGILVVSYIGYRTQEVSIGDRKNFSIVLHEDTESLDEVVVIGYGTQKKSDLTGSVTSIKAESLKGLVSGNASEALQGKSGVYVTNPRAQIKRHPRKEIVYDNGITNFSSADVCLFPLP